MLPSMAAARERLVIRTENRLKPRACGAAGALAPPIVVDRAASGRYSPAVACASRGLRSHPCATMLKNKKRQSACTASVLGRLRHTRAAGRTGDPEDFTG